MGVTASLCLIIQILLKANKIPVECFSLYQKFHGCDFEKISLDEEVDLSRPGIEKFAVKPPVVFYYTIDAEPETTDEKSLTANSILELAGLNHSEYYLIQILPDNTQISYKDNPDTPIEMKCPGLKFISAYRSGTQVA